MGSFIDIKPRDRNGTCVGLGNSHDMGSKKINYLSTLHITDQPGILYGVKMILDLICDLQLFLK